MKTSLQLLIKSDHQTSVSTSIKEVMLCVNTILQSSQQILTLRSNRPALREIAKNKQTSEQTTRPLKQCPLDNMTKVEMFGHKAQCPTFCQSQAKPISTNTLYQLSSKAMDR